MIWILIISIVVVLLIGVGYWLNNQFNNAFSFRLDDSDDIG